MKFHLPRLSKKKQTGCAKFNPRNGFFCLSTIPNLNNAFAEKISEQCTILFNGSSKEKILINGKEIVVGCWITDIRDIVVSSKYEFFKESNHVVGEFIELINDKNPEIFGGEEKYLKLLKNPEIKKIIIRVV